MKRLLMVCGLTALMAMPAVAASKQYDPQQHATRMQKSLQLDDKQVGEVTAILTDAHRQRQQLADRYKISERDAFRAEAKKVHEAAHMKIEGLLSASQRTALAEQKAERQAKMKRHHEHHARRHAA